MHANILSLHKDMTELVLESGVGPDTWVKLVKNVEKWDQERQGFVFDFLKSFKTEWQAVYDAKNQFCATDEMWENMKDIFGEEDFPEMVKLKQAKKQLKKAWIQFKDDYRVFREVRRGA